MAKWYAISGFRVSLPGLFAESDLGNSPAKSTTRGRGIDENSILAGLSGALLARQNYLSWLLAFFSLEPWPQRVENPLESKGPN
jgi:hypothetical protein